MLTLRPFEDLGGADHGWLNAKHHFSFAGYYDPAHMSHGELLVINDDRIAPKTGFDTHPHQDMEIITYVRRGAITHKDSRGNEGRTTAGNVQVMTAGTGIRHSEYNHEDEETNIYQIWILPKSRGVEPSWDAAEFPKAPVTDSLSLLVGGDESAPLRINQDARIFAGRLGADQAIEQPVSGKGYLLVSEGEIEIGDLEARKGDGIMISDEAAVKIRAKGGEAEVLLIEVPGVVEAR